MHTKARGNFLALSGVLVAAVFGLVTFFTWEFFGTAEQASKPRIVYGASGTAYASSRPSKHNIADHVSAAPLGENLGLKDPEVPHAEPQPEPEKPEAKAPDRAAPKGLPKTITESTEKGKWIFIDKAAQRLYLVERNKVIGDWGVSTGKVLGQKMKVGDMRTPEGTFSVQQIQDASSWTHDFKDGKGVIKGAYGPWFIRLKTPPHTGIGIHGTHEPEWIGTPRSEGCIRLQNENLRKLKEHVKVGMKVIIGPDSGSSKAPEARAATVQKAPAAKTPVKNAPKPAAKKPASPAKAGVKKTTKRK